MKKVTFEQRGNQFKITRLLGFDLEGFVHMLFYRVLIFVAFIYGAVLLLSLSIYPQLSGYVKPLTLVVWVLITPQLYETFKGMSMMLSGGMVHSRLSEEYTSMMRSRYKKSGTAFVLVPYVALLLWIFGFAYAILWWTI